MGKRIGKVVGSRLGKTILELGAEIGVEMVERPIGRTEMYIAEEAFYCGTGQEISPVTAFDGRPVGSGKPGPVTRRLQAEFDGIVRGNKPDHESWRTRVYKD